MLRLQGFHLRFGGVEDLEDNIRYRQPSDLCMDYKPYTFVPTLLIFNAVYETTPCSFSHTVH